MINPASILYKSIAGRYRPVSYPDGPMTARYRFIQNAFWEGLVKEEYLMIILGYLFLFLLKSLGF